jgi:hypothetical protein
MLLWQKQTLGINVLNTNGNKKGKCPGDEVAQMVVDFNTFQEPEFVHKNGHIAIAMVIITF